MRAMKRFQFILLCGIMNQAYTENLTPYYEPKDDIFFVCYHHCRINYSANAPLDTYDTYRYVGCVIQRTPCCNCNQRKHHKPSCSLNVFGQFNNYPDALNAFYRCAYRAEPS